MFCGRIASAYRRSTFFSDADADAGAGEAWSPERAGSSAAAAANRKMFRMAAGLYRGRRLTSSASSTLGGGRLSAGVGTRRTFPIAEIARRAYNDFVDRAARNRRARNASEGEFRDRLRSERSIGTASPAGSPHSSRGWLLRNRPSRRRLPGIPPMRLIWSQPAAPSDRPRVLVLLGVVCIFLGGAAFGRPGSDAPRPFRAAAASLVGTGFLAFLAGGTALAFQR